MNKQILDAVFTMARLGLAEIAKDTRNGAGVVANHAAALEQWRAEMEKQLLKPQPIAEVHAPE